MECADLSPLPVRFSDAGKSPSHPLLGPGHHHRGFWSSDVREEAIARGRWELMEMVKHLPESSYELSLKDLVENIETADQGPARDPQVSKNSGSRINYKKGLFLNILTMFPSSLNKRKNEKESWKKRYDGGRKNISRKISGTSTGCCPFLC